jgi:inorganic pyrophosphatase
MKFSPYAHLKTFDEDGSLNAIIETPKGSRNKFDYDSERGIFKLGGVLPAGASFPFDFGFVPLTLGEDGDPLDVLVLMEEPAFSGCLVPARLIGVIEAEQTERDGTTTRNDRLIAVAANFRQQRDVHSLEDLNPGLIEEIEHFFVSYNEIKNKHFQPMGCSGPERALELVEAGQRELRLKKVRKREGSTKTQGSGDKAERKAQSVPDKAKGKRPKSKK